MTICSVVGARPQFIKAAVVSKSLANVGIKELLVHTGQHYDDDMSANFFSELGIPPPVANLGIGSGSHAIQTAGMMRGLEKFLTENPDVAGVVVYGDTNSTLSASIVAAKLHIPIFHVEAGLRSFNRRMPEEINRVVTDHLSSLLFCPTPTAVSNLEKEGVIEGVLLVGDVMFEATMQNRPERGAYHSILPNASQPYFLATVHRAENTDEKERLQSIFDGLDGETEVFLPLHPRTAKHISQIHVPANVRIIKPLSYRAMLSAVQDAERVLTDSGGLQKEAYWLGTPCITLRDETEWVETTHDNWNIVVGSGAAQIKEAIRAEPTGPQTLPALQSASEAIAGAISEKIGRR